MATQYRCEAAADLLTSQKTEATMPLNCSRNSYNRAISHVTNSTQLQPITCFMASALPS
jgi:hypothetical protein